ncbi:bifunctional precorrin-2 dehydrogenase/sirohydrochlorin ferrochelatase [Ktedonosporobacter rubrisoli]|uniref:precorrin-2 dehydrogenase n=1 Tax=Ktedonosporobacter rubrisoli TaxID=2509675 RepID=A0A4P6K1M7_KTERU|nr:bifunctional precorrin-2 dehydrogenase/sirohydrochlorin ferrochelatase [Ktedonosporobacter rubrisoli]QBD81580.1 bifunctional precorrin-2 dehydrogenase/sirohydrochlorin ferrochelatase [Ktedonosporobacter rubrisoli]
MPNYYPIMLDVRGREAVVVGGNSVAGEKALALSKSGARVTVMHTEFCPQLQELAQQQTVTLRYKGYERGDLASAFVVVAAVSDAQLIEEIWQETQERGQLLNIVDVPARCNFIVPSILRRGKLTIAVSTEGASPGLAKRIRQDLEGLFPASYDLYLQLASVARAHLKQGGVSYADRDDFFGKFFAKDILSLLTENRLSEAVSITRSLLADYGINVSSEAITADLQAMEGSRP